MLRSVVYDCGAVRLLFTLLPTSKIGELYFYFGQEYSDGAVYEGLRWTKICYFVPCAEISALKCANITSFMLHLYQIMPHVRAFSCTKVHKGEQKCTEVNKSALTPTFTLVAFAHLRALSCTFVHFRALLFTFVYFSSLSCRQVHLSASDKNCGKCT